MQEIEHRTIRTNGIDVHVAMQGEGPPVIMGHGFPGLWYSWRHQLPALAAAGYRAIAVDQRGYGGSSRPEDWKAYDADQVAADMLGLLDALGEERAVFVGHDFGAPQAWDLAMRWPERVAGVIVLSVPFDFSAGGRGGAGSSARGGGGRAFASPMRPTEAFAAAAERSFLHLHYFQKIGPADRELNANPRLFLERLFWALSAQGSYLDYLRYPSAGHGYLDVLADPPEDPPWPWLTAEDFEYYVSEFQRTGFTGGLNWYRVADRNWKIWEPFADANVHRPALFICGESDPVLEMVGEQALRVMRGRVTDLRDVVLLPGAGHWVQQERPREVNEAMLAFLAGLELG